MVCLCVCASVRRCVGASVRRCVCVCLCVLQAEGTVRQAEQAHTHSGVHSRHSIHGSTRVASYALSVPPLDTRVHGLMRACATGVQVLPYATGDDDDPIREMIQRPVTPAPLLLF
eukprot:39167-Rhodomonas_salina.2